MSVEVAAIRPRVAREVGTRCRDPRLALMPVVLAVARSEWRRPTRAGRAVVASYRRAQPTPPGSDQVRYAGRRPSGRAGAQHVLLRKPQHAHQRRFAPIARGLHSSRPQPSVPFSFVQFSRRSVALVPRRAGLLRRDCSLDLGSLDLPRLRDQPRLEIYLPRYVWAASEATETELLSALGAKGAGASTADRRRLTPKVAHGCMSPTCHTDRAIAPDDDGCIRTAQDSGPIRVQVPSPALFDQAVWDFGRHYAVGGVADALATRLVAADSGFRCGRGRCRS